MSITLPFPEFIDGTDAYGSQVQANFDFIVALLDGQLDDANIENASITANTKLVAASILAAQIANANIRSQHIDWTSANSGVRAWRTPGYAGTNGNRLIRVEKEVTLAAVTTEQSFSIDWSAGDSPDGAITFGSAPTVSGLGFKEKTAVAANQAIAGTPNATLKYIVDVSVTTTGCTVLCRFSTAPAAVAVILKALVAGAA